LVVLEINFIVNFANKVLIVKMNHKFSKVYFGTTIQIGGTQLCGFIRIEMMISLFFGFGSIRSLVSLAPVKDV
jgi:hypothetical protein